MKTTIVNLFGGPGTGKSTNAALSFGKLKVRGITAEYISEFAKDLVWEERHHALGYQPYLSAKQIYRIQRVIGKVPVIITDSPILLSLKHPYVPLGRTQQTVDEARKVDRNIENFLNYNEVPHATLRIREGEETANILADLIEEHVNE
jgi:hypothetical protein